VKPRPLYFLNPLKATATEERTIKMISNAPSASLETSFLSSFLIEKKYIVRPRYIKKFISGINTSFKNIPTQIFTRPIIIEKATPQPFKKSGISSIISWASSHSKFKNLSITVLYLLKTPVYILL